MTENNIFGTPSYHQRKGKIAKRPKPFQMTSQSVKNDNIISLEIQIFLRNTVCHCLFG